MIPNSQQYLLKVLLSNWSPLSEMRVWRILNRVTMFFHTNLLTSTSLMFASSSASTHLVKLSVSTKSYLLFLATLGKGPTMSKSHWAKGQRLDRGLRIPPTWWMLGANLWYWSHFFTYSCTFLWILGHQYPWVRVRWDKNLPSVWLLQVPLCNSSRSGSTASGWMHSMA